MWVSGFTLRPGLSRLWSMWGLREPCRWAEKPSHPQKGGAIQGLGHRSGVQSSTGALVRAAFSPPAQRLQVDRPGLLLSAQLHHLCVRPGPLYRPGHEMDVCPGSFAKSHAWHQGSTWHMPCLCSHGQLFWHPGPWRGFLTSLPASCPLLELKSDRGQQRGCGQLLGTQ